MVNQGTIEYYSKWVWAGRYDGIYRYQGIKCLL